LDTFLKLLDILFPQAQTKPKTLGLGRAGDLLDFAASWRQITSCIANGGCETHYKLKTVWEQKLSPERRQLALRFSETGAGLRFQALMEDWDELKIKQVLTTENK